MSSSRNNHNSASSREEQLDRVVRKYAGSAHVGPEQRTPLEVLIASEEGIEDVLWDQEEEDKVRLREVVGAIRYQTFGKLLEYFFQYGMHPLQVLRMVFAVVKVVKPELIANMSLEDIAVLCGDGGKATVSARIQRIYNDPLEESGQVATASFQKRGSYSAAQMGNTNRKAKKRGRKRV